MAVRLLFACTIVGSSLPFTIAQPPCNQDELLIGDDVGNMPLPIDPTRKSDGQACAFECMADKNCRGFNYVETGSCGPLACRHNGGCCWLKRGTLSSLNVTDTKACGCSFIMRPDPAALPPLPPTPALPPSPKNVLYVLVDDLRPDVAPFGADWMVTPNLQALAGAGTAFTRAYCNIAVCSPSRMSFLTGRYPHHTRTWNFLNHFRQATCVETPHTAYIAPYNTYRSLSLVNGGAGQCCSSCTADGAACLAWTLQADSTCLLHNTSAGLTPKSGSISGPPGSLTTREWTSLPQHFTEAGWLTLSSGKIFHTEEGGEGPPPWDSTNSGMPPLQDPPSWSRDNTGYGNTSMANVNSLAPMRPCSAGEADPTGNSSCSVRASQDGSVGPDVFQFCDRIVGDDAVSKLAYATGNYKATGQPFFMAVGFRKPHLPFRHPAPWDSLYPSPSSIPLALHKTLDASVPPIAYHETTLATNPYVPMEDERAGVLRRDYYAAISWMDWNLGRVLAALTVSGVSNDTAIVFHADHGWSLGEHGEWEKFTNFEHGTRVPLIVSAPWLPSSVGRRTDSIAELIDIFPTLAELAGIPVPASYGLDGRSLLPLLQQRVGDEGVEGRAVPPLGTAALSVYPRCPADLANTSMYWANNDCLYTERGLFPFMGVSLRVDHYRYTEWLPWNGTAQAPSFDATPVGVELYDHTGDNGTSFDGPWEVINVATDPAYSGTVQALAAQMRSMYPS